MVLRLMVDVPWLLSGLELTSRVMVTQTSKSLLISAASIMKCIHMTKNNYEWRAIDFESCSICGDNAEALLPTDTPEGMCGDGDEVRCVNCHYPGCIAIDDSMAWVDWVDDGYPAEAANKIEKLEATSKALYALFDKYPHIFADHIDFSNAFNAALEKQE